MTRVERARQRVAWCAFSNSPISANASAPIAPIAPMFTIVPAQTHAGFPWALAHRPKCFSRASPDLWVLMGAWVQAKASKYSESLKRLKHPCVSMGAWLFGYPGSQVPKWRASPASATRVLEILWVQPRIDGCMGAWVLDRLGHPGLTRLIRMELPTPDAPNPAQIGPRRGWIWFSMARRVLVRILALYCLTLR